YGPVILIVAAILIMGLIPVLGAGRSPHVLYRPGDLDVGFEDVVGIGVVRDEVIKTVNLFLAYKTFQDRMGGNPRKGLLFEGPPGTGKTYMAKAMAKEAGVPFLYVSSSAFQSMYYGQTNRKIRSYFRSLRKYARREGGAIGFIEEIDAIAAARSGMRAAPSALSSTVHRSSMSEGTAGIVNELLIQMQSFDEPTKGQRFIGVLVSMINAFLPPSIHLRRPRPSSPNVLVIAATNRAADLDPALLRPGRFDRSLHFDLPSRSGRREIIDYYLDRKVHDAELDTDDARNRLAMMTHQYSPVMIEHLFDEGLVWALREGRDAMSWKHIQQAKLTEEIGLKQPVEYTEVERRAIATHEAGHATVAFFAKGHRLELLSIIKRRDSLGLLAHSDIEERFTSTRSELIDSMRIAFGGMVAEELFFGESGTGPSSDLSYATRIAAMMVGALGMAGSLVSFDAGEARGHSSSLVSRVLGDDNARQSVERLLDEAKTSTRRMLDENRHVVEALRDALLEHEELVGEEIVEVIGRAIERAERGRETTQAISE
ncbi:MAG: AAA family ATPase, partial [Acidimicrobiia bacterium]